MTKRSASTWATAAIQRWSGLRPRRAHEFGASVNLGDWWRHLDPAVAGGVVGGLVGGIATLIGGFGGAWLIGWLEARREERQQVRDHGAAVRAVIYELTTILSGIGLVLDHHAYVAIDTPEW